MPAAPTASEDPEPLGDRAFARAILPFAPFENQPLLAVALSGGGDSLALVLLADAWARARQGRVVALTVDHGLRPNSGEEAQQVARWMHRRAIEHHVLPWTGPKPVSRLQEAAREARYDLLRSWCGAHGVLHLLVAHTQEDQAETVLLRREAGSGAYGLAGMSACVEFPEVRILRPLLDIPRARLRATLAAAGQPWIEDPSNRDVRFARVRARHSLTGEPGRGALLCRHARDRGLARQTAEGALSRLAAECLTLGAQGYANVITAPLAAASAELRARFWGGVIAAVGGRPFRPDAAAAAEVAHWLSDPGANGTRTLGGCRIKARGGVVLVVREMRNLPAPRRLHAGERMQWDGRFRVEAGDRAGTGHYVLGALGGDGWSEIGIRAHAPKSAVMALPALRDHEGVVEVPGIGYVRGAPPATRPVLRQAIFSPGNAVAGIGFFLAPENSAIISCSDDAGITSRGRMCPPGLRPRGKDRP